MDSHISRHCNNLRRIRIYRNSCWRSFNCKNIVFYLPYSNGRKSYFGSYDIQKVENFLKEYEKQKEAQLLGCASLVEIKPKQVKQF
jgi:hypothetical protein